MSNPWSQDRKRRMLHPAQTLADKLSHPTGGDPSGNTWAQTLPQRHPGAFADPTAIPDWLQMQLDAVDSQYAGGGGGGGGAGGYSVPSIQPQIDALHNFQNTGNAAIQNAYSALNASLGQSADKTAQLGTQTTADVKKTYDDNAAQQAALLAQLQASTQQQGMGGSATAGAVADQLKAIQGQVAGNQSNIASDEAASLANQKQYAEGMAAAAKQAQSVAGTDQTAAASGFNGNIANQVGQLMTSYQSDLQKAAAASASASQSSSNNAGKAQAAKEKLLASYMKDQEKASGKTKTPKKPAKGLAAVIAAAAQSGDRQSADTFAKLLDQAQSDAAGPGIPNGQDSKGNPKYRKVTVDQALKNLISQYSDVSIQDYMSKNGSKPKEKGGKGLLNTIGHLYNTIPNVAGIGLNMASGDSPLEALTGSIPGDTVRNMLGGGKLEGSTSIRNLKELTGVKQKSAQTQQKLQDLLNFYLGEYGSNY